jgi:hypothetical protein
MGTYTADGNLVKANVMVRAFLPGVPNVTGVEGDFELNIVGTIANDVINGKGSLPGDEAVGIAVKLTKRASLPD